MVKIEHGTIQKLHEKSIFELLKKSIYKPTAAKMKCFINELDSKNGHIYLATEKQKKIGIFTAIETLKNQFVIKTLFVRQESRKLGTGRLLINEFIKNNKDPEITAETDDDAVAFYHSLGFRIYSLGEQYPGIIRYKCIYDHLNWKTYSYTAIIEKFKKEKINCWVSGGIAIDLHLNKRTRIHKDVDISILRKDQLMIKKIFSDWEVFHTHAPGLRYWKNNEYLEKTPNVWLRKNKESPWAFEVMFQESENNI